MLSNQEVFLVVVALCLLVGLVLSFVSPERKIIERKIPDEEVWSHLLPKVDGSNLIDRK
jgi:hypothetical protein